MNNVNLLLKSYYLQQVATYSTQEYNEWWNKIKPQMHLQNIKTADSLKDIDICPSGIDINPAERIM